MSAARRALLGMLVLTLLLVPSPAGAAAAAVDPAVDREQARRILEERRFRELEPPRPLRRPLRSIAARLRSLADALAPVVPDSRLVRTAAAALAVAALVVALVGPYLRRRSARPSREGRQPDGTRPVDPGELERQAAAAEGAGDLEQALRLRFRAGLVRLAQGRRLTRESTLPSGELSRRLGSPRFDELSRTFDEVVYGGRPARADDLTEAREGWPRVVEEAGRR